MRRLLKLTFAVTMTLLFFSHALAAPSQVIIIRHADKLEQEHPGPTLSAKGQLRAVRFAYYYQSKFNDPDFIFASSDLGHGVRGISIREIQTVAPLANMISLRHPEMDVAIYHSYAKHQVKKLAHELLMSHHYKNKRILICWEHKAINKLVSRLGVKETLPDWPGDDFDTVYVIDYDTDGNVQRFQILHHQYAVSENTDWQDQLR